MKKQQLFAHCVLSYGIVCILVGIMPHLPLWLTMPLSVGSMVIQLVANAWVDHSFNPDDITKSNRMRD